MDRQEYYAGFGWSKSPFIKTTSPETPIVKREEEYIEIQEAIGGWDRLIILTAPIGYGKTTFMNQVLENPPDGVFKVVSFSTYTGIEAVMAKIMAVFPWHVRLFNRRLDRESFGDLIRKNIGGSKLLLIFDEAQDYPPQLFKWLRTLNDQCENAFMLFIGLPGLEDKIASETALRDRKSRNMTLKPLKTKELTEIVENRIKWVGGDGITPFTKDGVKRLCISANQIPRKLLDDGQKILEYAANHNIKEIDGEIVENMLGVSKADTSMEPQKPVIEETKEGFIRELSPTQKDIVTLLLKHERLCISEIGEELDKDIRSIGSLIRKLRGLNKAEVERKPDIPYPVVVQAGKETRQGRRQYVYSLSDNSRRLLAEK